MKKLSVALLAMLLIASLFTSCDNNSKAPIDELVEVKIGTQDNGRGLIESSELETIGDPSLKWFYSATKTSQTEFSTGQTTRSFISLGDTKPFSQGKWNFVLWAEKEAVLDESNNTTTPGTMVYKGSLNDVMITKSASPVPVIIAVSPYIEGQNGSLVFNGVKIRAATSTTTTDVTVVPNTVRIGTDSYTLDDNGSHAAISLAPGQYEVLVAFVGSDGITYASETKTVTIYSNRVTTLSGMVDEETASAEITVVGTAATVGQQDIESKVVGETFVNKDDLTITAPVTPAKAVDIGSSVTIKNTEVKFDEGSFNLTGETYDVEMKIDTTSIEDSNFAIEGADATAGLTSVAGLDIVLKVDNTDVTSFNSGKKATVTTYIAKNLTSVGVRYQDPTTNVITAYTIDTVDSEPTTITGDGYYIASSGKLVFKTTHFSEYYVVAEQFKALNATQGKVYNSFADSIADCNDGDTVKLFDDVRETANLNFTKDVIVDLNQKTLTVQSDSSSSVNADITLKNGNINAVGYAYGVGAISIESNSNLIMDHVNYTSEGCGIVIDAQTNDASVSINNSVIRAEGYNAIGTNASRNSTTGKTSENIRVTIKNSTVTADMSTASQYSYDCVAVLFNIPGTVVIEDSTLTGDRQALILRGGEGHVVRNSILNVVGTGDITKEYLNGNWGSGNEVPLAALVIGNRGSAYAYPVSVTLDSVELKTPEKNGADKPFFGIYVWQNSDSYSVSVSGSIDSSSTNKTVNSNKNGALCRVEGLSEVLTISTAEELFAFANDVNVNGNSYSGKTIMLIDDINLNNMAWTPIGSSGSIASYPSKTFAGTFDGNNHTISNLCVDVTGEWASAGLFGTANIATIKNVIVDRANIKSTHYAGGILGYETETTHVINCTVTNSTITSRAENSTGNWDNGDKVGGIVGYMNIADVSDCDVSNTTIQGYRDLGGIVGFAGGGTVKNSSVSDVTIKVDNSHNYKNYESITANDANEIIGENYGELIDNTKANVTITSL